MQKAQYIILKNNRRIRRQNKWRRKSKSRNRNRKCKKALEGTDVENIKTATEKLTTAFYAVSEKLYSQAAAQNQGAEGTKPEGEPKVDENGNVYDADYKVENENNGDNKQD